MIHLKDNISLMKDIPDKSICFMDNTYEGFHHHFIVPRFTGIERFEIYKNKYII